MTRDTPVRDNSGDLVDRRSVLASSGATITALSLAGCLGDESEEGTAESISVAAVEGEGSWFDTLADEYLEDETGIEINVELLPFDGLFEQLVSVLDNRGDEFDVVFMDDPWFPRMANHLEPLEQWLPDGLPDELIQSTVDIATWPTPNEAVPPGADELEQEVRGTVAVGNAQLFAYNTDHFDEVGEDPPETWDDVLEAGQAIDSELDDTAGFVLRGERGNPINASFYAVGGSMAGRMFDDDWSYNWSSTEGRDAIDLFANELADISPEGVTAYDSDEVITAIGSGEAAQGLVWPGAASDMLDGTSEGDNIEFTVIPEGTQYAPTQGNWIASINTYTGDPQKRAAGEVLQEFISREAQELYVEDGGVPFRHDIFEEYIDHEPWMEALYNSLPEALPRPRTTEWNEIEEDHGIILNNVLTDDMTVDEAVEQAEEDLEDILDRAGYYA
ncbi:extracellular solute-binding protein [Halostagnicola sp. A-GB9-2]|uniref:extracellular solute-binding protein n=1 Tax=Halostagnicola sp. A-GB9-2 TaxID=3048066 RepID=UPI0024BF7E64|nr:extracellular solute-binding protein [Halostagnicola sp. A-GB9-2]MDJ1433199.1 extracellular solute-binding protein [Halostagnicola sp. A-GB9-2]